MNHNILLISALIIFAFIILRIYFLFLLNTEEKEPEELTLDETIKRAQQLYANGMHLELQRFLKKELTKKYQSLELRKILIRSYLDVGNTSLAALHLEAVLKVDPSDMESREELGRIYLEDGNKRKALAVYEAIYAYNPTDIVAIKNLAQLYRDISSADKAIKMYNLLLEAEDDPAEIVKIKHTVAQLYLLEGYNDDAQKTYEDILEITPDDTDVIKIISELAYKKSDWQTCLMCYEKLGKINGENIELLEKIALMYYSIKDWDKALLAYRKLIDLEGSRSTNYLHYQNRYCEILIHKEQVQEAIEILTNLIADFPNEDSLAYTLAQAYTSMGEYEKAIGLYENLIENLPPEQTEILKNFISGIISNWAMDLFNQGEYTKAFDKFFEGLKYNQDNAEIYYKLGKCNCEIKSYQDAIGHFKRAISIAPQESKYYFGLGYAYDEIGDIKNAKTAFYDAISINPLDLQSRKAYAITLTKELEYANACEQFLEILKSTPDDADTMYNLALAYEILGEKENALQYYQKALDVQPQHEEARHNLELLNAEMTNQA